MTDTDLPFRVLESRDFAALRALMERHDFTAAGVSRRAGLASIFDFRPRQHDRAARSVESGLDLLIRVFMDVEAVPETEVDDHLDPAERDLLERFGFLVRHPDDPGLLGGTVLLYPTHGPWLVSDRAVRFGDGEGAAIRSDAVYPALTGSAHRFLTLLPTGPVGDYLELCSGSGVAALLGAAAGAERAWAVDITARSTAFADFNARLNGLDNVTALQGDLWEPVAGRRFDIVVAHPPYVPAVESELIYRDGGDDGERITRAILGGLGEHLAPQGLAQLTCVVSSREGRSAPERVRDALGEAGPDFDLVFVRHQPLDLLQHFRSKLLSTDPEQAGRAAGLLRHFDALKLRTVHFCTLVLMRHGTDRPGFTLEVEGGADTDWAAAAWILAMGTARGTTADPAGALLDAPARLSPHVRFEVSYRPGRGAEEAWVPDRGRMRVDRPFVASAEMGMNEAVILAEFDGSRTLRQQLDALRAQGRIPADAPLEGFARSLDPLVVSGILESGRFPLP